MKIPDPGEMVQIGQVVRAHGIRGELVVRPQAGEHEGIFQTGPVWLVRDGERKQVEVVGIRWHRGDVLLRTEEITDRSAAERHRGFYLEIPAEDLPDLDEGTYYVDDLIGCQVLCEGGDDLGVIENVLRTGGVDVLEVRDGDDGWMLPAAAEFILDVDLSSCRLIVRLPEGLRDLHC